MEDRRVPGLQVEPPRDAVGWWRGLGPVRNLILFLLTVLTTFLVGGLIYSVTLMTILMAHELGHFLMSRKYRVPASLPFFIPFLPPFGTLGAIIKMRGRMSNRRVLFDVAVTGPLAGFFFTVPSIVLGLRYSTIIQATEVSPVAFQLGESILFRALSKAVLGPLPEGSEVLLHPIGFAGWIGLYVTALNLLPIGQLDGGHIVYALLGQRSRVVYSAVLIVFACIAWFFFRPWFFLIGILVFFRLFRHPPPMDDATPIGFWRKLIGFFVLLLFILAFTPVPFPDLI